MVHAWENSSDRRRNPLREGLASLWRGMVLPMLRRPRRLQVAALCYRGSGADTEVLLLTSRDTGRWVLPKGWPMGGRDAAGAAGQEAWEEAGVRGRLGGTPIGSFGYDKRQENGWAIPVEILVYPLEVSELAEEFPEAGQRQRQWFAPQEAARLVQEPGLAALLAGFSAPGSGDA